MDFTYEDYLKLINYYNNLGFECGDIASKKQNMLILRHDVDYSISLAHSFATFEFENGISSIYFIMVSSDFYNPNTKRNINMLESMIAMGHSIGLHFDASKYNYESIDILVNYISNEKRTLENIIKNRVSTLTFHRPLAEVFELPEEIDGMINLYSRKYFEINYFSDSRRNWRRDPYEIYLPNKPIQLLVHPIWFELQGKNTYETLVNLERLFISEFWKSVDENINDFAELKRSSENES